MNCPTIPPEEIARRYLRATIRRYHWQRGLELTTTDLDDWTQDAVLLWLQRSKNPDPASRLRQAAKDWRRHHARQQRSFERRIEQIPDDQPNADHPAHARQAWSEEDCPTWVIMLADTIRLVFSHLHTHAKENETMTTTTTPIDILLSKGLSLDQICALSEPQLRILCGVSDSPATPANAKKATKEPKRHEVFGYVLADDGKTPAEDCVMLANTANDAKYPVGVIVARKGIAKVTAVPWTSCAILLTDAGRKAMADAVKAGKAAVAK